MFKGVLQSTIAKRRRPRYPPVVVSEAGAVSRTRRTSAVARLRPYEMNSHGFSIRGVEHLRERFSKRANQVKKLAEAFAAEKGRKATKREIEILVRESRQDMLTEVSTPQVRARQRAELSSDEARGLDEALRTGQT